MNCALKQAAILIAVICFVNSDNNIYRENNFQITKDWIITVNTSSSVIRAYNTTIAYYCMWQCFLDEDCFVVNVIPVADGSALSYTCELLPAVVSVYNFQHHPGALYYRKPCSTIPDTATQILNDKNGLHYAVFEGMNIFDDAIGSCNSYGMKLVALETEDEYNMVLSAITTTNYIYIAAYEVGVSDTFKWINHDAPISYYNWGNNEPNDANNPNGVTEEHCIVVSQSTLKMSDYPCADTASYICECPYII